MARKCLNKLEFNLDPYKIQLENDWDLNLKFDAFNKKIYEFDKWDKDIINSPISHIVEKCRIEVTLTSIDDVNKQILFLENLKPCFIKKTD